MSLPSRIYSSVPSRFRATEQRDVRSELVLEFVADALIALPAELQRPADHPVTSIA